MISLNETTKSTFSWINRQLIYFLLSFFLIVSNSMACKFTRDSSWYYTRERVAKNVSFIWYGEVTEIEVFGNDSKAWEPQLAKYKLKLLSNVKGKFAEPNSEVQLGPYQYYSKSKTVSYGTDCKTIVNLKKGHVYKVMHESFSPYAFEEIDKKTKLKKGSFGL